LRNFSGFVTKLELGAPDKQKSGQPAASNGIAKTHAIQLACSLPEDKKDALMVLQVLRRRVEMPGF
jgi:hypothetical protein